jgi:hypothetical protein
MGKDVEGIGGGLIDVLSQNLGGRKIMCQATSHLYTGERRPQTSAHLCRPKGCYVTEFSILP